MTFLLFGRDSHKENPVESLHLIPHRHFIIYFQTPNAYMVFYINQKSSPKSEFVSKRIGNKNNTKTAIHKASLFSRSLESERAGSAVLDCIGITRNHQSWSHRRSTVKCILYKICGSISNSLETNTGTLSIIAQDKVFKIEHPWNTGIVHQLKLIELAICIRTAQNPFECHDGAINFIEYTFWQSRRASWNIHVIPKYGGGIRRKAGRRESFISKLR
jgi:hypothetical protein